MFHKFGKMFSKTSRVKWVQVGQTSRKKLLFLYYQHTCKYGWLVNLEHMPKIRRGGLNESFNNFLTTNLK